MPIGVFGKLPAKRDFVAREIPAPVLHRLEPWLQQSLAQSRDDLGAAWTATYLAAPIWRFWLEAPLLGRAAQGALMPSVDGVGRYFPLILVAIAEPAETFPAPGPAEEPWFEAVETVLLSALSHDGTLDDFLAAAGGLREPLATEPAGSSETACLWWTAGGGSVAPQRVAWSALPPPSFLTAMLTGERGRLSPAAEHGEAAR